MTEIEKIRAEIKRLDAITDDDSLPNDEYQAIELQISQLYAQLNVAMQSEKHERLKKKAPKLTQWEENFLASFGDKNLHRIITKKQFDIFLRIAKADGHTCEFSHGNFRYYATDTRNNYAHLVIEII